VATRLTRATGDRVLPPRRRLPPLFLAPRPRLLLPEEALRAPLRRDDDLRPPREDLRALPALRLERFRAPALFRPEDPERDLFLPPPERLDLLAAAIGQLRVAGF